MSYEGYTERLCEHGHYWAIDVYAEDDRSQCPTCGAKIAFIHHVDQTNGYDESDPATCDAPKEEKGFTDQWHEDHHGNRYATKLIEWEPTSRLWRKVK